MEKKVVVAEGQEEVVLWRSGEVSESEKGGIVVNGNVERRW